MKPVLLKVLTQTDESPLKWPGFPLPFSWFLGFRSQLEVATGILWVRHSGPFSGLLKRNPHGTQNFWLGVVPFLSWLPASPEALTSEVEWGGAEGIFVSPDVACIVTSSPHFPKMRSEQGRLPPFLDPPSICGLLVFPFGHRKKKGHPYRLIPFSVRTMFQDAGLGLITDAEVAGGLEWIECVCEPPPVPGEVLSVSLQTKVKRVNW